MPGKRSNIICPKCKRIGGALSISWSKEQSGVPKLSSVRTIADAFDAIGKMYLNLTYRCLILPPNDDSYNYFGFTPLFSKFFPYDQNKLNEIINNYFHNSKIQSVLQSKIEPLKKHIEGKIAEHKTGSPYPFRHIINNERMGKITKLCIAFLYGALVYFSISDLFKSAPFNLNGDLKYAHAVYHFHKSFLYKDRRNSPHLLQWFDILIDSYEYGNSAAISLNKHGIFVCKQCSKLNKRIKEYVYFQNIKNDKGEYVEQCPNCGSQELLQKKLITGNYLKKIKERKITEIQDFDESVDLIDKLIEKCANYIKNSNMLIYNFKRNEEKFLNGNLGRKEYFSIGHYNPENKNKKCCRFSDLSQIKLDHPKYITYEAIISTIVDAVILLNRNRSVVDPELKKVKYKHSMIFILNKIDSLGNFLEELKFPRRFCEQKIQSDLISFFQKRQSKGRGNLDNLSYYSFVNLLVK